MNDEILENKMNVSASLTGVHPYNFLPLSQSLKHLNQNVYTGRNFSSSKNPEKQWAFQHTYKSFCI